MTHTTPAAENDPRPRVFLGMPGYGDISGGAARAFYWATSGRYSVRMAQKEGSLATANMNRLWCDALNEARTGRPPDYFAMIHSDITAEDHWLDVLIPELEARDLDVLGVVVPIKDQHGLTSTAVARPDGMPWRVHARLSMAEVFRLPETFTSADVGYPLLLNTGLWVCKFREDWARNVFFTVNDKIVTDPETGEYVAECESEDWFASRLFHKLGLKVGATRKVRVGHEGRTMFGNRYPWGQWEYDRALVSAPVVPEPAGVPA